MSVLAINEEGTHLGKSCLRCILTWPHGSNVPEALDLMFDYAWANDEAVIVHRYMSEEDSNLASAELNLPPPAADELMSLISGMIQKPVLPVEWHEMEIVQ